MFSKYAESNPAESKKRVGWHQDHLLWALNPPEVITCWIAIDPVGAAVDDSLADTG